MSDVSRNADSLNLKRDTQKWKLLPILWPKITSLVEYPYAKFEDFGIIPFWEFELCCGQTDRHNRTQTHRQMRMNALLLRLLSAWIATTEFLSPDLASLIFTHTALVAFESQNINPIAAHLVRVHLQLRSSPIDSTNWTWQPVILFSSKY